MTRPRFLVFTINVGCGYTFTWATFDVRRRRDRMTRLGLLNESAWSCDRRCLPWCQEVASRAAAPVFVTTLGVLEQNVARQLFFMLAMMTKGPALAIVRQAEISGGGPNGLEAWRLLVRRYEPQAATRWVCCNRS